MANSKFWHRFTGHYSPGSNITLANKTKWLTLQIVLWRFLHPKATCFGSRWLGFILPLLCRSMLYLCWEKDHNTFRKWHALTEPDNNLTLDVTRMPLCNLQFQPDIWTPYPFKSSEQFAKTETPTLSSHKHAICQWNDSQERGGHPWKFLTPWMFLFYIWRKLQRPNLICSCPIICQRTASCEDVTNHFSKTLLRMSYMFLSVSSCRHLKPSSLFPGQPPGLRSHEGLASPSEEYAFPHPYSRGIVTVFCGTNSGDDEIWSPPEHILF